MIRLQALNPETTTGKSKELFNGVQNKLGMVPNMMRTMGNSPAVLDSYLNLSGTLGSGALGAKLGELIALTVAEENSCHYCLSAHAFIGEKLVKINTEELQAARKANSFDDKTKAALTFAKTLVQKRGQVNDEDVQTVKTAGYNDGEVAEIVAHVALNTFTNYINNTANTEIDFPVLEAV